MLMYCLGMMVVLLDPDELLERLAPVILELLTMELFLSMQVLTLLTPPIERVGVEEVFRFQIIGELLSGNIFSTFSCFLFCLPG